MSYTKKTWRQSALEAEIAFIIEQISDLEARKTLLTEQMSKFTVKEVSK